MWVFLNNAMLSIVEPKKGSETLLVRARIKGDIERVFPGSRVIETERRDYQYRAFVPREEVAETMMSLVKGINYDNFKDSIPKEDRERKWAYHDVWEAMFNLQERLLDRAEAWWMNYRRYPVEKDHKEKVILPTVTDFKKNVKGSK